MVIGSEVVAVSGDQDPAAVDITVPSGCRTVLLTWIGWSSGAFDLDTVTLAGNPPAELFHHNDSGGGVYGHGIALWYGVPAGTRSLDVEWATAVSFGPVVHAVYLDDVRTIFDTSDAFNPADLETEVGDLVFKMHAGDDPGGPAETPGYTTAENSTNLGSTLRTQWKNATGADEPIDPNDPPSSFPSALGVTLRRHIVVLNSLVDTFGGADPSVPLGFTPFEGSTLLVAANQNTQTFTSVSDNSSGDPEYDRILSTENLFGPDTGIWIRSNVTGAPTHLNFDVSGTSDLWVCVLEVLGLDNASPLDDAEVFATGGDNTAHSQEYVATVEKTLAFSILVNAVDFVAAGGSTVLREDAGAGIAGAYQVFRGTGPHSLSYTVNPSSSAYTAGVLLRFDPGGSGPVTEDGAIEAEVDAGAAFAGEAEAHGVVSAGASAGAALAAQADTGASLAAAVQALAAFDGNAAKVAAVTAGASAGADFTAQATAAASLSAAVSAGAALAARAQAIAAFAAAVAADDSAAAGATAEAALLAAASAGAQMAAVAEALAAIEAGIAAGEAWAAEVAAAAQVAAGGSFGAAFSDAGSQTAALAAGTVNSAAFLGAVAALGLLQAGASATAAFLAQADVAGSITENTAAGAVFLSTNAEAGSVAAAAQVSAAFASAVAAIARLQAGATIGSVYSGMATALGVLAAGVRMGATFRATSSADVSILGAVASVRSVLGMSSEVVNVLETQVTIQ